MKYSFPRSFLLLTISGALLAGCGEKAAYPDVDHIQANIKVRRFDRVVASIDTASLPAATAALVANYPGFYEGFFSNVLGIPVHDEQSMDALLAFSGSYQPVFAEADSVWRKDSSAFLKDLRLALQLARHYFPEKPFPNPFEVITFVGPMDAFEPFGIGDYGDVSTRDGAGLALQFYLGAGSGIYEAGMESGIMNEYQVRRFEPDMMVVNTVKNMVLQLYPYQSDGAVLLEEMIEKGKRMYILKKLLPSTADSLQFGYPARGMQGCLENEALIWDFFVKSDLLYSKEPQINQLYIRDGPKTQELGEGAPGYIGLFVGRRIVETFMEKNKGVTLQQMMAIPFGKMLEQSGYKPG